MAYFHTDSELNTPTGSFLTGSSPGSVLESVVEYQRFSPQVNERSHTGNTRNRFINSKCKKKGKAPPAIYAPDVELSFEDEEMKISKIEIGQRTLGVKKR